MQTNPAVEQNKNPWNQAVIDMRLRDVIEQNDVMRYYDGRRAGAGARI